MKITEKKAQDIRKCTRAMRKSLREHYDNYDAAVYQMKGCIRRLKQHYDDETIKMAFDVVSREMLESRKTNKKRVTEMGRLSNAHTANQDKIAAAKAHATNVRNNAPEKVLMRYVAELEGTLKQFCNEVNEDSYRKLGVFDASAELSSRMKDKGIYYWIGICPLEDPEKEPDEVTEDERCCCEFAFHIYLQPPTEIGNKCGEDTSCEMENYAPIMRRQGKWDELSQKIYRGTLTTDDLWAIVESDPVFTNWLMTGDEDPAYNQETGEYDEDQIGM